MVVKIYFLFWAIGLLAAATLYLTGFLDSMAQLIFGFLTLCAIFMGMMAVLPHWSDHHLPPKH